jgi:hypothetical protein
MVGCLTRSATFQRHEDLSTGVGVHRIQLWLFATAGVEREVGPSVAELRSLMWSNRAGHLEL